MSRSTITSLRLLPALLTLCLASCIDIREEYWLHEDGSARAELSYDLPTAATRTMGGPKGLQTKIQTLLDEHRDIATSTCQVTASSDRTKLKIQMMIPDVRKLRELADAPLPKGVPPNTKHLAGTVSTALDGLSLQVNRQIHLAKAIPAIRWTPAAQLQGHKLVYIMHLPEAATASNAHDRWNDGKSLLWEFPLETAATTPISTQVTIPLPIPWRLISPIGAATAALAVLIFRKRRTQNTKTST